MNTNIKIEIKNTPINNIFIYTIQKHPIINYAQQYVTV
jgi:hypothetical protein